MKSSIHRRDFLKYGATSAAALTIVPRHVLGGAHQVPPSEKLTLAYIGCGTQGLREMLPLLSTPEVQIVAVCDPVKNGNNYVDWSKDGLRESIAKAMGMPHWRRTEPGIPGGREVAKELIETVYANERATEHFHGCDAYADFRELLEAQKDVDAVKIMTFGLRPLNPANQPSVTSCSPAPSRKRSTWGRFHSAWEANDSFGTPMKCK